eukprot:TRINITY_DN720_c2_g2_i4.p1 TRINITY_DN720_c2_g2~~TRINITY_DN720_c2_g2_i4.p1  ORF type:complete len:115 (+),score=3.28 TRINITY_DN720_c2_g2_i4:506-850(+)
MLQSLRWYTGRCLQIHFCLQQKMRVTKKKWGVRARLLYCLLDALSNPTFMMKKKKEKKNNLGKFILPPPPPPPHSLSTFMLLLSVSSSLFPPPLRSGPVFLLLLLNTGQCALYD